MLLALFYFSFISIRNRKRNFNQTLNYKNEGTNIALGMSNGKALHRQLISQVHPDRVDPERREEADQLSRQINAARYDYRTLLELQKEVNAFIKPPNNES